MTGRMGEFSWVARPIKEETDVNGGGCRAQSVDVNSKGLYTEMRWSVFCPDVMIIKVYNMRTTYC